MGEAYLAMLKYPRCAERDEDATGGEQFFFALRQRHIYAVQTAPSVHIDTAVARLKLWKSLKRQS